MSTSFETFLMELAKVVQIPQLIPDSQGACLILLKKTKSTLLFQYDERWLPHPLLISSKVCSFPIELRATLSEESLDANLSSDVIASIHPHEDSVYLHQRIHPSIEAIELEKIVQNFQIEGQKWKDKIAQLYREPCLIRIPRALSELKYKLNREI